MRLNWLNRHKNPKRLTRMIVIVNNSKQKKRVKQNLITEIQNFSMVKTSHHFEHNFSHFIICKNCNVFKKRTKCKIEFDRKETDCFDSNKKSSTEKSDANWIVVNLLHIHHYLVFFVSISKSIIANANFF